MPAAFVNQVAEAATWRRYDANEYLIRERQLADGLHLILKGKVALELASASRGGIQVQTAGAGEVAGWSWLIPPYSSYLDVRALEPTETVKIDATCLRGLLKKKPATGFEFLMRLLPVLAQRLEYTMIQLTNLYGI